VQSCRCVAFFLVIIKIYGFRCLYSPISGQTVFQLFRHRTCRFAGISNSSTVVAQACHGNSSCIYRPPTYHDKHESRHTQCNSCHHSVITFNPSYRRPPLRLSAYFFLLCAIPALSCVASSLGFSSTICVNLCTYAGRQRRPETLLRSVPTCFTLIALLPVEPSWCCELRICIRLQTRCV